MARTLRLIQMAKKDDFDEIQLRPDDIRPDEDTSGWFRVIDHGEEFFCSATVLEVLLWISRPHTTEDP